MRHGLAGHPVRKARDAGQGGFAAAACRQDRSTDGLRRVRDRHQGRHASRLRPDVGGGRFRPARVQLNLASRRPKLQPVFEPVRQNPPRRQARPRADVGRRQGGLANLRNPRRALRGLRPTSRPLPPEDDARAARQGLRRAGRFEARNRDDLDRGLGHGRRGVV